LSFQATPSTTTKKSANVIVGKSTGHLLEGLVDHRIGDGRGPSGRGVRNLTIEVDRAVAAVDPRRPDPLPRHRMTFVMDHLRSSD
jgi:hypothetical protein